MIDAANTRKLDFRVLHGRIGGGSVNGIDDPRNAYRFSKLFGKPGEYESSDDWYAITNYADILKKSQEKMGRIVGVKKTEPVVPAPSNPESPAELSTQPKPTNPLFKFTATK